MIVPAGVAVNGVVATTISPEELERAIGAASSRQGLAGQGTWGLEGRGRL
jgi:hypothetical protein